MAVNQFHWQDLGLLPVTLCQYVVRQPAMPSPLVDGCQWAAAGQIIGQSQEQDINAGLAGVSKVAINCALGRKFLVSHLDGAQVIIDKSFHQPCFPIAKSQPLQNARGHGCALLCVAQKPGSACIIKRLCHRLSNVMQ